MTLTAADNGTTLVGTYTVSAGDNSTDLTVSSFSIGTVTDIAGNVMASTAVPDTNIASGSAIVIDTTAPTLTFFVPLVPDTNEATSVDVNITITFSEAVRLLNDNELTDINIDSLNLITLKYTFNNQVIDFDATINDNKTIITINPTNVVSGISHLVKPQSINAAIGATVEDYVGHAITGSNATFQTQ